MKEPRKISLIVPSRERLELIIHFLYTALKRAKDLSCVEIVLVVDADDNSGLGTSPLHEAHCTNRINYSAAVDASCTSYKERIESFLDKAGWRDNVKILERGHELREKLYEGQTLPCGISINNNEECYNFGAGHATGDVLWALGDDCEILSEGWDEAIFWCMHLVEEKNLVPDGAYYIRSDDGTHAPHRAVCAFPIITREAYNKMGCLTLGEFYSWMADFFLYEIYSLSKVNRIFDVRDRVKVAHYTKNTDNPDFKREEDGINRKINLYTHNAGSMTHQYFDKHIKMLYVEKLDAGIE